MNRAKLVARVAELEKNVVALAGVTVFHADKERKAQDDLTKARAELAAMRVGLRRIWFVFDSRGRRHMSFENETSAARCAQEIGGTYCEMIEVLPASEEVLEALKQSDFGCHGYCNVKALARDLRARLPKGDR